MSPDDSELRLAPPYGPLDRQAWVGRLARSLSHQLASPLTALVVTAEYLVLQLPEGESSHADAVEIHRAAARCSELLESFRELVRRERGPQRVAIDLRQVFDGLRPLLQHALMISRLSLEAELPRELPRVCGQRAVVEHLLVRLLFGAVDRAPAGARVLVGAGHEAPHLALSVVVEPAGAAPPAPPALLDGLGLAACEELAAELDGRLEAPAAASGARPWCGVRLLLPTWG